MRAEMIAGYIKLRNIMYGLGIEYGTIDAYHLVNGFCSKEFVLKMDEDEFYLATSVKNMIRNGSAE